MTRRADRLFQIVQILRGRRLTTAALLAERLGVSERTVYRDIRDLSLSGVPVEGEAGSGYRLLAGYDLPPLMLTTKESEALIAAIRLLKTWGGEALSQSLESAQEKMLAILPEARRRQAEQTRLFAPDLGAHRYAKTHFDVIHQAVSNQQVLQLHYRDESGQVTWREVLPLGLFFWGERWLLVAWCELRNDYRNFRLDRCLEVRRTERRFSECADRSLSDFPAQGPVRGAGEIKKPGQQERGPGAVLLFQQSEVVADHEVTTPACRANAERTIAEVQLRIISPLAAVMEVTGDDRVVPVRVVQRQDVAGGDRVAGARVLPVQIVEVVIAEVRTPVEVGEADVGSANRPTGRSAAQSISL